jgi:hypothetical protein
MDATTRALELDQPLVLPCSVVPCLTIQVTNP